MYITDDGKTRVYIRLEEGRLEPYLGIGIKGTAVIEWGDDSEPDTVTGNDVYTVINTQHVYPAPGKYVIAIDVTGSLGITGGTSYGSQLLYKNITNPNLNRVYQKAVQKVEIGRNVSIRNLAFQNCYGLASITIPDGVTDIGTSAFHSCYNLASITIPNSVTNINSSAFQNCYGLGLMRFVATTPPTVASSNAWASIPTDCVIYVPSGTLAAYTSATNYPSSSTYTYVEY